MILALVALVTPVAVHSLTYYLTLQVSEFRGQQVLFKKQFFQTSNRRSAGVSVYSAAKQIHVGLIKMSFNNWPFSIMPQATAISFLACRSSGYSL